MKSLFRQEPPASSCGDSRRDNLTTFFRTLEVNFALILIMKYWNVSLGPVDGAFIKAQKCFWAVRCVWLNKLSNDLRDIPPELRWLLLGISLKIFNLHTLVQIDFMFLYQKTFSVVIFPASCPIIIYTLRLDHLQIWKLACYQNIFGSVQQSSDSGRIIKLGDAERDILVSFRAISSNKHPKNLFLLS